MSTDMMLIGMLSRAKKAPSMDARGPLKPSLNSATRQMERINKHVAATMLPAYRCGECELKDLTDLSELKCILGPR